MEQGSEGHGVDHELRTSIDLEPDDLEQVAGVVRSDGQNPGWVGVGLQVDDRDGVSDGVEDRLVVVAMFAGGTVDLHT